MKRSFLIALTFALGSGLLTAPTEIEPRYVLPPGPAAKLVEACAGVAPRTATFKPWPQGLDDSGWERVQPWTEWAELVRAEAESEYPKPLRRAELTRIAIATDRHGDAWAHFESCASQPELAAAILPYLFPGLPLNSAPGAEAASGVTLRPLLPPQAPEDRAIGSLRPSSLSVENFRIAGTLLTIKLDLARDGVQIDVLHQTGPPVELGLVMASPEGYFTKVEYLDWDRLEDLGRARVIRSSSESEAEAEHSYWGRFAPSALGWPGISGAEPKLLLERLREVGIVIEAEEALQSRACGLALALSALFDIRAREAPPGSSRPSTALSPIVLRLSEEHGLEGLRIAMELAERLAFSPSN